MKEWFEGKTVALVGNAQSLFNKEYGAEIDNHEVVVRLNKAAMLYTEFEAEKTHGKKTNVWIFWNAGEYKSQFVKHPHVKKMHAGHQARFDANLKHVDFTYPNIPNYELLRRKSGNHNNPTTGFIAIDWITSCSPKSLDIYGFDWKDTPTFTDPRRIRDKGCPHDFETERKYIRDNILTLPYVRLRS
jgi:hypothetical protein